MFFFVFRSFWGEVLVGCVGSGRVFILRGKFYIRYLLFLRVWVGW